MQTGKKSFKELVPGQELFYIPKYQRNYSWEEEHWDDLWEDLLESIGKTHYIGTLLIEDAEGKSGGLYEDLGIIDGQQRFTTLTILLFELQRKFRDHGRGKYAKNILNKYVLAEDQQRLRLQEDDKRFFKEYILEGVIDAEGTTQRPYPLTEYNTDTPSKERLLKAKEYFTDKLEKAPPAESEFEDPVEFFEELYDAVQNLDLLAYVVKSRAEAARIFQTVNDRGKGLTDLEITKSYLMHRIALATESEGGGSNWTEELISMVQESFSEMYSHIDQITNVEVGSGLNEDQIQRYHFIVWNTEWTTSYKGRFYQDHLSHVKEKFGNNKNNTTEDIIGYVKELERAFYLLRELVTLEGIESERLKERLQNLFAVGRLGNFYPLLITAYDQKKKDFITEEQFLRLLKKIETFIVRTYLIEQKAADTGRTKAYPLARQLYYNSAELHSEDVEAKSVEKVIEALTRYIHNYCSDKDLEDTLVDSEVYPYYADSSRLNQLRYLLYAYELHLEQKQEQIELNVQRVVNNRNDRFTIEHIWPQEPSDELEKGLQDIIQKNKHRLGNLALMTLDDNAFQSNDTFDEKRRKFEESKFRMLNEIFDNQAWSVDRIEKRERRIVDVIKNRWPDEVSES